MEGVKGFLYPNDAERAAVMLPATYYVFDLLGFCGFDLRPLPLTARKEILKRVLRERYWSGRDRQVN